MKCYRVKNWDEIYENNRTRELKKLDWFPMPNKQDGDGYTAIMEKNNGAAILGSFVACVQIASRCNPRGTLIRDGQKPHNSHSLARMSRIPAGFIQECLDVCSSNDVNWLEIIDLGTVCDNPAPGCDNPAPGCLEEKEQKEQKEQNGKKEPPKVGIADVFNTWNVMAEQSKLVPQCLVLSDKRSRSLEARLRDSFFETNWNAALFKIPRIEFLTGTNNSGWKACFDWFIQPDSVAKIMEGKYDKAKAQKTGGKIAV